MRGRAQLGIGAVDFESSRSSHHKSKIADDLVLTNSFKYEGCSGVQGPWLPVEPNAIVEPLGAEAYASELLGWPASETPKTSDLSCVLW